MPRQDFSRHAKTYPRRAKTSRAADFPTSRLRISCAAPRISYVEPQYLLGRVLPCSRCPTQCRMNRAAQRLPPPVALRQSYAAPGLFPTPRQPFLVLSAQRFCPSAVPRLSRAGQKLPPHAERAPGLPRAARKLSPYHAPRLSHFPVLRREVPIPCRVFKAERRSIPGAEGGVGRCLRGREAEGKAERRPRKPPEPQRILRVRLEHV